MSAHDLSQLPPEVHGVLHADVEALPALRRMHVRGVARPSSTAPLAVATPRARSCRSDSGRSTSGVCAPSSVP